MRWFGRGQRERDLAREIRSDLELEAEEQRGAGLPADLARFAARRALGNPGAIQESVREAWRWTAVERTAGDVRYGLRLLRKNPGFSAVAILSLALGIGANTAIFGLIDALLFKSLPVRDPASLLFIAKQAPGGNDSAFYFLSIGGPLIHLDLALDWRVLAFTAGVSMATGLLFGLAPALRGASLDLAPALNQGGRGEMELLVRAASDGAGVPAQLRREVPAIDPYLPAFVVRSLAVEIDAALIAERLLALISTVFGALAALLAAIGLYGVKPRDPMVIAASAGLLLGTAAIAGYIPARRAARIDPMTALRDE